MNIQSRLGCQPELDPKSLNFPVGKLLTAKQQTPRSYTWRCQKVLDQGNQGSCVGHGWAHELIARPSEILSITHEDAVQLYYDAQRLDQWEGGEYPGAKVKYSGSSVLAGAKAAMVTGHIGGYYWAFGFDEFALALSRRGPCVCGTNWLSGMSNVDSNGFLHATGSAEGGHCYLINQINISEKYIGIVNSWGTGWGVNGTAKLSFDDAELLLFHNGGVACFAEHRRA